MDFSFLESLIGDPVIIKGCFIPGIFLSLLILLTIYIRAIDRKKYQVILSKNKLIVSVLIIFTSIVLGSANSYIVMKTFGKLWKKPHPFIYYFMDIMELEKPYPFIFNMKDVLVLKRPTKDCKIINSAITEFNNKRKDWNKNKKEESRTDSHVSLIDKYYSAYDKDELLFFYYKDTSINLNEEIYNHYIESGKEAFDRIKESIILRKSVYQKRLIEFEAKANMYAALITPCIFGLIILIIYFRKNMLAKFCIMPLILVILIINILQYRHMIKKTEPNCLYTAFYNLYLEEKYGSQNSKEQK